MAKVRIESPQESPKVYDVRGEKEITVKTKNETPEVTVGGGGGGGGDGIGCLGCLVLLFLLIGGLCAGLEAICKAIWPPVEKVLETRVENDIWRVSNHREWDGGHYILHSSDKGNSWTKQYKLEYGFNPFMVHFFNEKEGLVGGIESILKTSDGGKTWEKILDVLNPQMCLGPSHQIDFNFVKTIEIISKQQMIVTQLGSRSDPNYTGTLETLNEGKTWYFIQNNSKKWVSRDGGKTWQKIVIE